MIPNAGLFVISKRCGIPVIIMGETGCGKTRLIRFMCELQAGPDGPKNLLLMKVCLPLLTIKNLCLLFLLLVFAKSFTTLNVSLFSIRFYLSWFLLVARRLIN